MHYKHARRRTYGALMVRDVLRHRQCGIVNAGMDYSPVIYKDCFSAGFSGISCFIFMYMPFD